MSNRFFIILLIIIAGISGILFFNKQKDNQETGTSDVQATNHIKGEGKSSVVLTEYGDFQCSACWQFEPMVRQVVDKYKEQITFQFRHFPLSQSHPNAFAAHRAAEAAAKQNKFWEMHDLLFDRAYRLDEQSGGAISTEWTASTQPQTFFEEYAKQLGLDLEKFKTDTASQVVNAAINADMEQGHELGVTGTPTFAIDGIKIETPRNLEDFYKIIDEAIAKKSQQ